MTGVVRWTWSHYNLGNVAASVAFSGRIAYYGTTNCACSDGGYLLAIDTRTHRELWRRAADLGFGPPAAVADGLVFANSSAANEANGSLYAFDALTGATVWSFPLGTSSTGPTVANGVVFSGGTDGVIHAFDAATGAELWSGPSSPYPAKIAVGGGKVYFGASNRLYEISPNGQ